METAADLQPLKPIEEVMGNLKIDPSTNSNLTHMKDGSPSEATSCISSAGDAAGSVKEGEVDQETYPYPATNYYGYYYPGYDGYMGEPDEQGYYMSGENLEIQYPVMLADNGSHMYFMPGFQPGYNPYTPYLPVGADGQYVGQQAYPTSPMFQPSIASPGYFQTHIPYGSEFVSPYLWDPSHLVGDGAYLDGYTGVSDAPGTKLNLPASGHNRNLVKATSEYRNASENKGVSSAMNISSGHGARNQLKGLNKAAQGLPFQSDSVLAKGYFPVTKFPPYHQGNKGGLLYPNGPVNLKANGRVSSGPEKLKTRSRTNSINDFAFLNEQNHGPRTTNAKNALVSGDDEAAYIAGDGNKNNSSASLVRRDQYNLPDFPTKYDNALFFVIKSYSEDDIHKSIKYNVWASTPNGNKRLDSAYQEAQERMEEKGSKCPVFLFFSVNASGQFCGVAEMTGRVDFSKNMDFWQQDKWNGFFSVKWHIIKDVPNPQLRHIILENNDNKPVTNSRDTQEVRFPQGIEILNIIKNYVSKTSILDDFEFYESRQKVMQEKRIRPSTPHFEVVQQKATDIDVYAVKNTHEIRTGETPSD